MSGPPSGECLADVLEFRPPAANRESLTWVADMAHFAATERTVELLMALNKHLRAEADKSWPHLSTSVKRRLRDQTATGTDAEVLEPLKGYREGLKYAINLLAQAGLVLVSPEMLDGAAVNALRPNIDSDG